ncbi:hypothetical protein JB92DRAFT_1340106 [Gautieria morchelliformis]|nr:hypothetical protein JB92DRAFT_1340106 [Gautieria morchelliformis]
MLCHDVYRSLPLYAWTISVRISESGCVFKPWPSCQAALLCRARMCDSVTRTSRGSFFPPIISRISTGRGYRERTGQRTWHYLCPIWHWICLPLLCLNPGVYFDQLGPLFPTLRPMLPMRLFCQSVSYSDRSTPESHRDRANTVFLDAQRLGACCSLGEWSRCGLPSFSLRGYGSVGYVQDLPCVIMRFSRAGSLPLPPLQPWPGVPPDDPRLRFRCLAVGENDASQ